MFSQVFIAFFFCYNFTVRYIIQLDAAVCVVLVQGTLCEAGRCSVVYYLPVGMEPEGSSVPPQKPTI
jgi:hypothetical protein